MAALRKRRYTRPFAIWLNVRDSFPDNLEVQRFSALPAHQQDKAWRERRRHAPCDLEVSPAWDLDALYLRSPAEESYTRNLRSLRHTSRAMPDLMSMELLCFSGPLIPFRWLIPQTPCPADYRIFPPRGDFPNPDGGEFSLDSAWALRQGSIADNCKDPGRVIAEIRKEARDLTRKYSQFVPYQAVDFYRQSPDARKDLYPALTSWRAEIWVLQHMCVPLPPVLTYRARAFLLEKVGTPEGTFFEQVLEAEWTALVFARWSSDIPQRGIMWALSPRLRRNITDLGVENLLHGSRCAVKDIREWLREHDNYRWLENSMLYQEKGGSIDEPAQVCRKHEFVREFPRYRIRVASGVIPIR
jgi:hypothetical protein